MKRRVLVISSDATVGDSLHGDSYEVCSMSTLQEALDLGEPFDCAVVEAWLQDASAAQAADQLKDRGITEQLITLMRAPRCCAIFLGQVVAEGDVAEVVPRAVSLLPAPNENADVSASNVRLIEVAGPNDERRSGS